MNLNFAFKGTGKSTLVNFLNNVTLECKVDKKRQSLNVDLHDKSRTLKGGFSIGHTMTSETFIPAAYTPKTSDTNKVEDFTYIDNPGFK